MKYLKILVIFGLGAIIGVAGGGYLGYHIGSTNQAIKYAPSAGMVPVQEERRPAKVKEQDPPPKPASETPETETEVNIQIETSDTEVAQPTSVPEETAVTEPAPETGQVEEYVITPNDDSMIMWVGYKEVATVKMSMEGGFANFEGTLTVEDNDPAKSFVEVIVDMKTIFSTNSILTTVLKTEAFFGIDKFPQARFASTKIEPTDDGYMVTGNFTMKEVTQGIQFPATIERRDNGVYAKAEFIIDRKKWDVGYDNYEDSIILEQVVISFEILAEPAK